VQTEKFNKELALSKGVLNHNSVPATTQQASDMKENLPKFESLAIENPN